MSTSQFRVLAVDDDDLVLQSLAMVLPDHWEMISTQDPNSIPPGHFHLAFVDMHLTEDLNKREGVEIIEKLSARDSHMEIVAMSGDLDRELMESCLKAGASRFLAKPFAKDELLLVLDKIEALLLLQSATQRSQQGKTTWTGACSASQDIKRKIASFRGESGPILIQGESGTGKDVVAHLIHEQEGKGRPMICVNVAALPESLFESEVFGHVKGAFTGADANKMGLAEAAHGGDLFLDEIEALPLTQQAKLLRFLEQNEIRRVGAKEPIRINVRVIAATNRRLTQMVEEKEFREDLMWRLGGKTIDLPPLKHRVEDIKELTKHFFESHRPKHNKSLTQDALEAFESYSWPGNVRELKRVIEQLCLTAPLPIVRAEDVSRVISPPNGSSAPTRSIDLRRNLADLLQEYEKAIILKAVEIEKDAEKAAQKLGVSRSTFYKKLKDHNIEL